MNELPKDWLEQIRAIYPRRSGGQKWGIVKRNMPRIVKETPFEEVLEGTKRYRAWCDATSTTRTCYVMMASTFFGPSEAYLDDYDLPDDGSVELTLDQEAEKVGLTRGPNESDENLKKRVSVAMTMQRYAK